MARALMAFTLLFAARAVQAHPAPFSYVDVYLASGGDVTGTIVLHALDVAHDLNIPADGLANAAFVQQHASALSSMLTTRLVLTVDGANLPWTARDVHPLPDRSAVEIRWHARASRIPGRLTVRAALFPYDPNHQTFVNVYENERLVRQEVFNVQRTSIDFYSGTRQGLFAVFTSFTASGIHHIAIGPDHILFIIGLLLLGGSLPRLLAIVTAFTAGHSVTLALATLNIVTPPSRLVEPAIALSIVYVGADNLLVGSRGRDVRPWVALFFGLVHGFGFASVLRETGLPATALGLSLFSFNVGVELGQAVIVVVVASGLYLLRDRNAPLAARLATVGSIVVMLAGAFWFVERL